MMPSSRKTRRLIDNDNVIIEVNYFHILRPGRCGGRHVKKFHDLACLQASCCIHADIAMNCDATIPNPPFSNCPTRPTYLLF
jgi:hypothetical protein